MAEVLFILTTIFVAYVVYVVVGDQMSEIKAMTKKTEAKPAPVAAKTQAVVEKPVTQAVTAQETPATVKTASPQTAAAATKGGLKNPATGEVSNVPNNYRFAKRWIKEALVKEGLLDKVYKNNELDDKANTKIKRALTKLAKMDAYKG